MMESQPSTPKEVTEVVQQEQKKLNVYSQLFAKVFFDSYQDGITEISFAREALSQAATDLGVAVPKNLGDVLYSFRYRTPLPQSIQQTAPEGKQWIIEGQGRGLYRFILEDFFEIAPRQGLAETKIPDSTPGIVALYTTDDEQALLSKLRYNRLIDIFAGVTCYSLQNHLRSTVPELGQVETDEIYVGIDKRGKHFVLPIQAKGGSDKHNMVQIKQDLALCAYKFPHLVCRAIGAQFMKNGAIALFEFALENGRLVLREEKHYRLIAPNDLSGEDWQDYLKSLPETEQN